MATETKKKTAKAKVETTEEVAEVKKTRTLTKQNL